MPCRKASMKTWVAVDAPNESQAMSGRFVEGCARVATGHATAVRPRRVMNSRRLICRHRFEDHTASYPKWRIVVRGVCGLLRSATGDPRNVSFWHIAEQNSCGDLSAAGES